MRVSGQYRVPAPRQRVWEALDDPGLLAGCVPGGGSLTRADDGSLAADVRVRLGPVDETFRGRIRLEPVEAGRVLTASGTLEGTGADLTGEVNLRLEPAPGPAATLVTYDGNARAGGKLAAVGEEVLSRAAAAAVQSCLGCVAGGGGGAAAPAALPDAAPQLPREPLPVAPIAPRAAEAPVGGSVRVGAENRVPRWPDAVLAVGVVLFLGIVLLIWSPFR